jgi:hypothetical protein
MTKQKDLKQLIRARMERTGETYASARRNVVEPEQEIFAAPAVLAASFGTATDTLVQDQILPRFPFMPGDSSFWKDAGIYYLGHVGRAQEAIGRVPTVKSILEMATNQGQFTQLAQDLLAHHPDHPFTASLRTFLEGAWADDKIRGVVIMNLVHEVHGSGLSRLLDWPSTSAAATLTPSRG